MSLYEVSAHPLRSGKVKELPPEEYDAQVLLAEHLLNLPTTAYAGRAAQLAASGVVLQVNWQIEYGADPYVLAQRNAPTHRTNTTWKKDVPLVDPRAQQLVDDAATVGGAGLYPVLRSYRGPQR